MATPVLTALLDWDDSGTFVAGTDDISDRVVGFSWTRGRNADFSGEAMGQASLVLRDTDGTFSSRMDPSGTAAIIPGRPLWVYGTYGGTAYGVFYGRVERVTADPVSRTVSVEAYDPLRTLSETSVAMGATTSVNRTPRDVRVALLNDAARGNRNLVANPAFETQGTAYWSGTNVSLVTGDGASGTACLQVANGSAVTSTLLVPELFDGETYRFSAYLKSVSGSTVVTMYVGSTWQNVTITTSWARYSINYVQSGTVTGAAAPTLVLEGTGTFKIDNVALTRGAGLFPYAETGTGRQASYVANGNFDWDTTGWAGAWYNLVRNGSFETDTTGWALATAMPSGNTGASNATISRTTTGAADGTAAITTTLGSSAGLIKYGFSETFKAGTTYTLRFNVAGTINYRAELGVTGDYGFTSGGGTGIKTVAWTPSADRTGAGVYFRNATGTAQQFDAVSVVTDVSPGYYADTGPFGTASPATVASSTASPKYGARCAAVTIAAANEGIAYDFYQSQPAFGSAYPYTASAWLRSSSGTASVTLGMAWGSSTTLDTASTAVSIGTAWTQASVTWTPSAERDATTKYQTYVYVKQTDSSARTLYVDGVRVTPGTATDDFELGWWNLATGYETSLKYPTTLALSGNAAAVLATLNDVTGSRHWIEPGTASPYYAYTTQDRTSYAALATAETYANDFTLLDAQELDRSQVVNIAPVSYKNGSTTLTEYVSDETSVGRYGQRPRDTIDASSYLTSVAEAQARGSFTTAAYAAPRGRPTLEVTNRFPGILAREVGERIVVTYPALGITSRSYTILRIDGEIRSGGAEWVARYQLEEYPY